MSCRDSFGPCRHCMGERCTSPRTVAPSVTAAAACESALGRPRGAVLFLLVSQGRVPLGGAVVSVGKKLPRHGELHAIAGGIRDAADFHIEIDRRHDAVAELFLDERL